MYGVPHNQAIQLAGNKGKQARAQLCRLYGGTDPVKASLATYEWIN